LRLGGVLKRRYLVNTCLSLGLETLVPLFSDGHPDTVALRQGHVRLAALANHEDVTQTGGEGVTVVVLNVNNVE